MVTAAQRKKLRLKAKASAAGPKTHVVLSLDTYMGVGDGAPDYGYAGINAVYGPFTEDEANAFEAEKEAENQFATEYRVKRLEAA